MAEITAASVKSLRDKTGLPMMECKQALKENDGDEQKAIDWLREQGKKVMGKRQDRETACGRMATYTDFDKPVATMIELQCESAPVASHEEFVQLAKDLAEQLATGPGAKTPEDLLSQPSPSKKGQTLNDQWEDLTNRIREVFRLARMERFEAACGGYAHHTGTDGVLVEVEGGNQQLANEVAMQVAAMRPEVVAVEDLDKAVVDKEREILSAAARQEGKPENIIDKMVEGRLRNFYAERVLNEQPFVKDDKQTVGKVAKGAGMKILKFTHWKLGQGAYPPERPKREQSSHERRR